MYLEYQSYGEKNGLNSHMNDQILCEELEVLNIEDHLKNWAL